ncbi:LytS/YhcK type 5TM receptor domain-containing protein [Extibacter sp. GGCC_0201]|uniref:LytS/YhcK type 5TM receptor domain-containing protein n=1 Tax=Extibacter sp. GGCC_0201 TaxID=2731209 RepID=UPI001AA0C1A8|nr:LytS/YhcK type 5TM receptor domain-containing protein [Extibacter sp. GGCC_0201]MBO1722197.1 histidine kinase [Extibacter sp. GGCC_0201]
MVLDIFMNLMLNIGLLALIAQGLTKSDRMKRIFFRYAGKTGRWKDKILLSLLFGGISILSTYTGISVQGAIVNTRVIGVMAGGILGGPVVGIGAALIAGAHRYLCDIGGLTAAACAVSTIVEGLLGAAFSGYVRKHKWRHGDLFIITTAAEILQMVLILLIARPYEAAWALVKVIGLPMIIFNSFGLVIFIHIFNSILIQQDKKSADSVRKVLGITDQCLPYLRKGLYNVGSLNKAAEVIVDYTGEDGVIFTDWNDILCTHALHPNLDLKKLDKVPRIIMEAMENDKVCLSEHAGDDPATQGILENHAMLTAPLRREKDVIGSFSLLIHKYKISVDLDRDFVAGLANIISTQLELSELQKQKELRQKAEFEALQSQINPHFLFNSLSIITALCRERPEDARELLVVLGDYFRNTLQTKSYMIDIQEELNHVRAYLRLEKARFEERLSVEIDVPEELHIEVPQFILQPLVENAVKHGAMKRERGSVHISVSAIERGVRIVVEDNGKGMPGEVMGALAEDKMPHEKVGLANVHKRLKSIYGAAGGLHIQSSVEGTAVSFLIPKGGRHG